MSWYNISMKVYYYIYAHYEADTGELFHIGVGTWTKRTKYTRAYNMKARNKLHIRIANKHGIKIEIIKDNYIDRNKAVDHEVMLQLFFEPRACFEYGDGNGKKRSQETKAKISASNMGNSHNLGRKHTQAFRDKVSLNKSKSVINCRGEIFKSATAAAKAFELKNPSGISMNILGKKKSAGKYIDGTKIKWSYYATHLEL